MRKMFFVLNPGAGGGRSERMFSKIVATFEHHGSSCETGVTRCLDEAYHLASDACERGYDTIVAVGGDGTINRVMNGLYTPDGNLQSESRFGVIHTGTSPDFCKSYGIPGEIEAACERILGGKTKPVSIGMVRFENTAFKNRTVFFGCCANIGLGAHLAKTANSGIRTVIGDVAGTFVSLLVVLVRYRSNRLSVTIDGKERILDSVINVSIGKTNYIASGIRVAHDLTEDDDRLYSLAVHHLRLTSLPECLVTLYRGKKISNNSIFDFTTGREFHLHAFGKKVTVEFDGDPAGYLPCTIRTAPQQLPLLR
jgi:YegS/Rv2252/BmrU family lipid kinase